jgi:hypothetical protein
MCPLPIVAMLTWFACSAQEPPQTNSPARMTVIKYCAKPFRTFEVVGTDIKGVEKLEDLTAALRKYSQSHPGAQYELLAEIKNVPEREQAIIRAVTNAGIQLKHYWAARSSAPLPGAKTGPYGGGFEDILKGQHDRR